MGTCVLCWTPVSHPVPAYLRRQRMWIRMLVGIACLGVACSSASDTRLQQLRVASSGSLTGDSLCVIENGELVSTPVSISSESGDTLINGINYRELHPESSPSYAADTGWFKNKEAIMFNGVRYAMEGNPRRVSRWELMRDGDFRSLSVFRTLDEGNQKVTEHLVIPVRPGCIFQVYAASFSTVPITGPE